MDPLTPTVYIIAFHEPFMDLNIITNVGKSHYCLTHNAIKFVSPLKPSTQQSNT